MKSNLKRRTTILLILGAVFAYPIFINANFSYFGGYNSENLEGDTESKLKRAGYWNLTGTPIFIDDSDPNYNWSKTATDNDWCSGSGTWSDPYIIEDVTIDGGNSSNCIEIKNSDVYFRIENCTIYNSGSETWSAYAGIVLDHVNDGALINNNCSNNYYGISLVSYSNNNTIYGNTATDNTWQGIELNTYCSNNTVSGNTANNNRNGIGIAYSSDNNTISGNTVNNNNVDGIFLQFGDNNIVSGNIANNNDNYGIDIISGSYNTVSGNAANNAYDGGSDNHWDNGSIGNYWDDYSGVDANDDGIGDSPYNISGSAGSQDNYPIWWDAPVIIVNSPSTGEVFGINAPGYNLTIIEPNLHITWYTLDRGITNITFTGLTGTIDQVLWDSTSDGSVTIRFYANDTYGNLRYEQVQVVKRISEEGGIPGYNLFFLLGTLCIVSIIISKRTKKS